MRYQGSTVRTEAGSENVAAHSASGSIAMLAYRSHAVRPPTHEELDRILTAAQRRNRSEGVTGLLIYDQGTFYQWLEGPTQGLLRIWDSIRRDPRHEQIEVLREQYMPERFFGTWDMRLARRTRGRVDTALAVIEAPAELLKKLHTQPAVLPQDAWDRLFADVVAPLLRAHHSTVAAADPAVCSTPDVGATPDVGTTPAMGAPPVVRSDARPLSSAVAPVWHAAGASPAVLGALLLAVDQGRTGRYIDGLIDEGASIEALYGEVFEPAARWLGGLWDEDLCNDFSLTLGLGRLQVEARRLGAVAMHTGHRMGVEHTVLIAPHPGEIHGLGATLSSEMFFRKGWDVSCEFPNSDQELKDLLRSRWYDVLDLSLSCALLREHRLQTMGATIRAAQAASLNPALMVIVDGRSFVDRPQACGDVGADASFVTSIDAVDTAQRLLDGAAVRADPGKARRRSTAAVHSTSGMARGVSLLRRSVGF